MCSLAMSKGGFDLCFSVQLLNSLLLSKPKAIVQLNIIDQHLDCEVVNHLVDALVAMYLEVVITV